MPELALSELESAVEFARKKAADAMAKLVNTPSGTQDFRMFKAQRDFWEGKVAEYMDNLDRAKLKL